MPRLLFVEDEIALLETIERFFASEGYQVYTARGQDEAMVVFQSFRPDLVILDVMLNEGPQPEFDGFDVCATLREADYRGPVILVNKGPAQGLATMLEVSEHTRGIEGGIGQ